MTKRLVRLLAGLLIVGACCVVATPPSAAANPCVGVGWWQVDADCPMAWSDYTASASSGDGHTWVVSIQCANGGICAEHVECVENGQPGFMHDVYMDGDDVGDVCVPQGEIDRASIAQLVIREFKRTSWPKSDLRVQPPGGQTLVNFETNFFTPDHRSIEKTVAVAGQQVDIRATPTTYTFHFGDEAVTTTASPGRPYPSLDVTHVYDSLGTVEVSLDTTYSGEYRIGDGDWTAIPDTLTVAGGVQELEILEALPQLVLR